MDSNVGMDTISSDIVRDIAAMLNPRDAWRLSVCSSHLCDALPLPLRLRIVSRGNGSSLKDLFFVSPADDPSKTLLGTDRLIFGVHYLFWTYDYARDNRVFLGRHIRISERKGNGQSMHRYNLGLRPIDPNQTWVVSRGGRGGDEVPWEADIGLCVGGENSRANQPDSKQRLLLSVTVDDSWHVTKDFWDTDEQLQFIPHRDDERETIVEKNLIVHAIPDVCDRGMYLLYNPDSLKHGSSACEGSHAIVKFHFWIEDGTMKFRALNLSFTFGVPILEEDKVIVTKQASPLVALFDKNSARWGSIKYYMATAADVGEGRSLDMDIFMRGVKEHEDHTIVRDLSGGLVQIQVQDSIIDTNSPSFQLDADGPAWEFVLCA
jgi:hypothetical protein